MGDTFVSRGTGLGGPRRSWPRSVVLSWPLSTLGSFRRAFQNVFHVRILGLALNCASAYIAQGARVPQRFGSSQMFQRSVQFFVIRFAGAHPSPAGMWPIAPGLTRRTPLSTRIRAIPLPTPRCFVRNRVRRHGSLRGGRPRLRAGQDVVRARRGPGRTRAGREPGQAQHLAPRYDERNGLALLFAGQNHQGKDLRTRPGVWRGSLRNNAGHGIQARLLLDSGPLTPHFGR
ncbi:hypothetical protein QF038_003612 [Pseudarthrobacter sp. W1I19]|nr:hypothetical protein [Pseudarthrobacter sp. W1I19]